MTAKAIDFYVRNDFSIILLLPRSAEARRWAEDNIQLESWQNYRSIAIEPRYFDNIYEGITAEGMTIQAI